jgi:hypothetical protein
MYEYIIFPILPTCITVAEGVLLVGSSVLPLTPQTSDHGQCDIVFDRNFVQFYSCLCVAYALWSPRPVEYTDKGRPGPGKGQGEIYLEL